MQEKENKKPSKIQHKKQKPNKKRNNKTIKSNKQKRKKKREKEIENYIEQKFKIQKQQQPFYRILELALLNNDKILQEKQHQIKQYTQEQASTTQRNGEQQQNTTEITDAENILERKHKWKKK